MASTILIIGGGFSGVSLTHALAHLPWPEGVRLVVADRSGRFGRGAAFSTEHPSHLLNVPAGRMGALAEDEGHFLAWLRASEPSITGDAFVPRSRYGEYLEHLFDQAKHCAGVTVEACHEHVIRVERKDGRALATLASGAEIFADRVVLAIGNLPPRDIHGVSASMLDDRAYVRDPWAPHALEHVAGAKSILLVGTGLTMVDVVLALGDANPGADFVAVSRHGLLPQPHRDLPTRPVAAQPPRELEGWNGSASELLRMIRDQIRAVEDGGFDWREVINALRPVTASLWQRMPAREQSRFHRHVRPFWDTHRHRMSTRVNARVEDMIESRKLSIVAGRIAECERDGDRVAVGVRRRDGSIERHIVDAVVNCTGPCSDLSRSDDPLVASLRADGAIVPDALGIGIQTNADGAAIDGNGLESDMIFTLGGTRRPGLWESTAVPELRVQSAALAKRLHHSLEATGYMRTSTGNFLRSSCTYVSYDLPKRSCS